MGKRQIRQQLLQKLPKGGVCAEIGVYEGEFSNMIMNINHPKKLYLIDPWLCNQNINKGWWGKNTNQNKMDNKYSNVYNMFSENNCVEIIRKKSTDVFHLRNHFLDWAYIDGDHRYQSVFNDLNYYLIKVKMDGIIWGDDYGVNGWWNDGVTKAVDRFIKENELPLIIKGTQFIIKLVV